MVNCADVESGKLIQWKWVLWKKNHFILPTIRFLQYDEYNGFLINFNELTLITLTELHQAEFIKLEKGMWPMVKASQN